MTQPPAPSPTPRFMADWDSGIGPGFLHVSCGIRLVFADGMVALHLGLVFGELMLQWNYGAAGEEEELDHE